MPESAPLVRLLVNAIMADLRADSLTNQNLTGADAPAGLGGGRTDLSKELRRRPRTDARRGNDAIREYHGDEHAVSA